MSPFRPSPVVRAALATAAIATLIALAPAPAATQQGLGYFEATGDIGAPAIAGSTTYDAGMQTYTLTGAGTNMWATKDEFQFAYRKLTGNFILRAQVKFLGQGVEAHRKLGWIVRSSLAPDATYADAAVHGNGLTSLQYRSVKGGPTFQLPSMIVGAGRRAARAHGQDVHHVGRASTASRSRAPS